jgi:hypothetical protein
MMEYLNVVAIIVAGLMVGSELAIAACAGTADPPTAQGCPKSLQPRRLQVSESIGSQIPHFGCPQTGVF